MIERYNCRFFTTFAFLNRNRVMSVWLFGKKRLKNLKFSKNPIYWTSKIMFHDYCGSRFSKIREIAKTKYTILTKKYKLFLKNILKCNWYIVIIMWRADNFFIGELYLFWTSLSILQIKAKQKNVLIFNIF